MKTITRTYRLAQYIAELYEIDRKEQPGLLPLDMHLPIFWSPRKDLIDDYTVISGLDRREVETALKLGLKKGYFHLEESMNLGEDERISITPDGYLFIEKDFGIPWLLIEEHAKNIGTILSIVLGTAAVTFVVFITSHAGEIYNLLKPKN